MCGARKAPRPSACTRRARPRRQADRCVTAAATPRGRRPGPDGLRHPRRRRQRAGGRAARVDRAPGRAARALRDQAGGHGAAAPARHAPPGACARAGARTAMRARRRIAAACGLQPEASSDPARRFMGRAVSVYGWLAMTCGGRPPAGEGPAAGHGRRHPHARARARAGGALAHGARARAHPHAAGRHAAGGARGCAALQPRLSLAGGCPWRRRCRRPLFHFLAFML